MSWSLICAFIWLIAANVIAMLPSKDKNWRNAYVLIAIGIPLLGWLTWQNGPWIGLLGLAAGASILRWPVRYFGRWVKRRFGKENGVGPAE